jgi:hypothetical protein
MIKHQINYILGLTVAMILSVICGCHRFTDESLEWKPTNNVHNIDSSKIPTALFKEKIKVQPFVDLRTNKKEIAENITTKDDVAIWCTDRFKELLKEAGLTIVETAETLDIKGEIINFAAVEENLYQGYVGIIISARKLDGTREWQGVVKGKSSQWGRSHRLDNYFEVLSDAYLNAVEELLKNDNFLISFK